MEVKIILMQHMKSLAEIIGDDKFDTEVSPSIVLLANDKLWRVKLAVINVIPSLADFMSEQIFKDRFESVVLSWL